jgi:glycosyltransferase involved in cell wall biosynthesis
MLLSVIIPAYNEEKLVGRCVESVFGAIRANASEDWSGEVIVVDNNSSDRTAELAREAGAAVVFEPINQISRARNAGAQVARGDWFLFVDADSILNPATLADLLGCIRRGRHAGGGCVIGLEGISRTAVFVQEVGNLILRATNLAAGSFVFSRADAFREVGGFSSELYAAEELRFSQDLKRWAKSRRLKFTILRKHRHLSSGRKLHLYSRGELLRLLLGAVFATRATLRDPARLGVFYDGRR